MTLSQKHGPYCFLPFVVLEILEGQRATTDKNDPFLNTGFKHGKRWVDKNGAKCNMGFGRTTKKTPYLDSSSPVVDMGKRLRDEDQPSVCWREKRSVNTWKIRHCFTEDDVTWRTHLGQPCQGLWRDPTHQQNLNAEPTESHIHQHRGVKLVYPF